MGCASSKTVGDATTTPAFYRPPPSSFAIFDINAIEEPWLKLDNAAAGNLDNHPYKLSHVPAPLLEKLETLEKEVSNGPRTWVEVSRALEDIQKPNHDPKPNDPKPGPSPSPSPPPRRSFSFHTVEELDAKSNTTKPTANSDDDGNRNGNGKKERLTRLRKTESARDESRFPGPDPGGFNSVKANPFIVKDRLEKERDGKEAAFDKIMKSKRDPLSDFPEKCPPGGGAQLVVLYTTSLRGVRRTFEDCNRVRAILETHRVVFDERDVSLHGEFLSELRELLVVDSVAVPRVFVKGRYLGGVDEVVDLNESGRLGRILSWARVERGIGWQACEGCGGARFVPCLECGGSCKVMVGDHKLKCPKCNENGLLHCPRCH